MFDVIYIVWVCGSESETLGCPIYIYIFHHARAGGHKDIRFLRSKFSPSWLATVAAAQKFKLRGSVLKRSPQQSPRKLVMKVCSQNRTARVTSWCFEEYTTLVGTEPHVLQHATWIYLVWNQSASDISVGSSQMTSMSIWGTSQPAVSRRAKDSLQEH